MYGEPKSLVGNDRLHRLLITNDADMLRGYDYKVGPGSLKKLYLVLCKGFKSNRDYQQALARVGRFGEEAVRVKLTEVNVINKNMHSV